MTTWYAKFISVPRKVKHNFAIQKPVTEPEDIGPIGKDALCLLVRFTIPDHKANIILLSHHSRCAFCENQHATSEAWAI